ncbi:hypothetical protein PV10_07854 [Exophiala mesophila]|uniref:ADF-H domain-containing protein n=1 Tax=Exophiala mesophila TaxID=212818 RepID=A0A0D1XR61_EXOME|nr:uncharacterized protein PV10_07854 [Exophiala mesophila]KIV90566.1 hypothetical protein PV10_07854 [Exophiala mesophila]
MQSGISASADLHAAFKSFTSDSTLFALPITITSESLTPLAAIPFPSGSSTLETSLNALSELLTPTTPLYLLLRRTPQSPSLISAAYIPSRSPVRQKTLFAATRATLVRELGQEKFAESVFLTEREEVLDVTTWNDASGGPQGTSGQGNADSAILSTEERELQAVKRAEDEERHGTRGRDLMGDGGSGAKAGGVSSTGIQINVTDDAKAAFREIAAAQQSGHSTGLLVQFGIEIKGETIKHSKTHRGVEPSSVHSHIPSDTPSYNFYVASAGSSAVIFIYVCPGTSKIKERMIYASSRLAVLTIAKQEGVKVVKNLEAGDPEDLSGGRINEEIAIHLGPQDDGDSQPGSGTATPSGGRSAGFARPKRPGKR